MVAEMATEGRVPPSPDQLIVRDLQHADAAAWTAFTTTHADATLYHTLVWRDVIQEVFGHRPLYLSCTVAGTVKGILPLFLVRCPFFGSKLVSLPYDVGSGGALVVDEASERALAERAIELGRQLRVNYMELRCKSARPVLEQLGFSRSEPVLLSEMVLDDESQVRKRVAPDHRKAIRKAESRGITVREANSLEDFRAFYRVYLQVFRDFGTPPYGAGYFPALFQRLYPSHAVRLLLAFHEQRCVGGLLLFCWQTTLVSKFAACLPDAVPLRAYAALYWRAICLGLEEGYRRLSWGTSSRDQTGLIEFKERWGAQSHPAVVYALPVTRSVPSIERYYDSGGLARRLWRRLPLRITPVIGEPLNRWFC